MRASNTYLYFAGRCREAMTFYGQCFGAQPSFTAFNQVPPDLVSDPAHIMHSELHVTGMALMAGDAPPDMGWTLGRNFSVSLSCASIEEMDRLFTALGEGGKVTTPIYDAFWGDRIGLLTDRFGVGWMLSFR